MSDRRVVITGLGVVAPNGIGAEAFWKALVAGESAVDYLTAFDATPFPCRVAAEVRGFDPTVFMPARRAKQLARFSQFALAAARLALDDAGVRFEGLDTDATGICVGTSMNGVGDIYEVGRSALLKRGVDGLSPRTAAEYVAHAAACHIAKDVGVSGAIMTLASGCTAGLDAIAWGAQAIRSGSAKLVVAGGAEAPIFATSFAALCALSVLSKQDVEPRRASRPYDLTRDGMVLGEGAALAVLEDEAHARARGARPYAEIVGYSQATETLDGPEDAREHALVKAIGRALADAGLQPDDIGYANTHGSGLRDYDVIETNAFKRALGGAAHRTPLSSIKSSIGHALAAASSFQLAAACLALYHRVLPPTINLTTPDPDCDLDYVPNAAREVEAQYALVNARAMGGTHSVMALGRPDRPAAA